MNKSEIRTLAKRYTEYESQPYVTTDEDWDTLMAEALIQFSTDTLCLRENRVRLDVAPNVGVYNLRTAPEIRIALPLNVRLNGEIFKNFNGDPGPVHANQYDRYFPNPDNGKPKRWCHHPPDGIRFLPTPDTIYTLEVDAYVIHPEVIGEQDPILFPEEYHRTFAIFMASLALGPRAAGSSLERMERLDQVSFYRMRELMERASVARTDAIPASFSAVDRDYPVVVDFGG